MVNKLSCYCDTQQDALHEDNSALYHEDIQGGGGIVPQFLTLASDGSEWSTSSPGGFIPGEIVSNTHCIGSCMGCRANLDAVENRKFFLLLRIKPRPSSA
jgi:hypothetical protein